MVLKRKFREAQERAIQAVVEACRKEFKARGAKGDLTNRVRGEVENGRFTLSVNFLLFTGDPELGNIFTGLGHYHPQERAHGEPDYLHARGETGLWWTDNFEALKAELNQKFLSSENQITFELDQ